MKTVFHTYRVDKEWRVSNAPGAIVVIWLSYKESKRTELSPMKLSFPTQLMRLLLNILRGGKREHCYRDKASGNQFYLSQDQNSILFSECSLVIRNLRGYALRTSCKIHCLELSRTALSYKKHGEPPHGLTTPSDAGRMFCFDVIIMFAWLHNVLIQLQLSKSLKP